ncbi:MAG TPA: hypothetical protein VF605_17165 [Allosphingosinicella sp.]|jgi:hypothetical protein
MRLADNWKLIEIRFDNSTEIQWRAVADCCSSLFEELGEFDLKAISVPGPGHHAAISRDISIIELSSVLEASFSASQAAANPFDIVTISSNKTRRFIVTEDDGLIRLCLATDDPIPDFASLGGSMSDVSHLLITTDLFDFI